MIQTSASNLTNNSLARKFIIVDFFSKSYRYSAKVEITKFNVIDLLNNSLSDYLEVQDLYVSRLNQPSVIVETCETAALTKKNIAFAIIPNEADGLTQDHKYSFSKTQTTNVVLSATEFEIKGELEITCKLELNAILTTGTSTFMPIFSGRAVHSNYEDLNLQGSAFLVNKAMIDYFGLCPQSDPRPAAKVAVELN